MSTIISVENALCRIGRHSVLKIERFSIEQGQHWCIFGPNGSGKSLLANLIAGRRIESAYYVTYRQDFDPVRDIHIVSFEEQQRLWQRDNRLDISEYSDNAQDQGTLVEQLIRGARMAQVQDQELLEDLVQQLALESVLLKGIRFLSSGQIRKVLIARALYANHGNTPQLVILDDPLESIDKDSQQRIARCIEAHMTDNFCSLQLCRRQREVLPGVTHLALMKRTESELGIVEQGLLLDMKNSRALFELADSPPVIPDLLPFKSSNSDEIEPQDQLVIRLDNVNASYGEQVVLSNIRWHMKSHHHVLIEGPNGCGKSTLLSLIDGENHKGYGQEVFLFGRRKGSGETVWDIKAKFGIVSNELHNKYVKGWRVLDVVVSGFYDSVGLYDEPGGEEADLARQWLRVLNIGDLQKHYYHEISFGQQRLVLLARAMVKQPRILVLDEPCVGLDDNYRQLILDMLDAIAASTSTQIIYVSHVDDERPRCINQKLTFVKSEAGGYTLQQSSI